MRDAIYDDQYVSYVVKNSLDKIKEYGRIVAGINIEINGAKVTNEQLCQLWDKADAGFQKMQPWFYIPWYISEENMITDKVKDGLITHKEEIEEVCDLQDALGILIFPNRKVGFQKEQEDFFSLVTYAETTPNFEQDKKFIERVKLHVQNYGWMKTYFFVYLEPLSESELINKIKAAIENKSRPDFELQQKIQQKNASLAAKLEKTLNKDASLIKHINQARDFAYVLTAGVDEGMRVGYALRNFYDLVASRIEIKKEELQDLTSAEIHAALKGIQKIDFKELERRQTAYTYALLSGETYIASGEHGKMISNRIDEVVNKTDTNISEFNGHSASRGHAKGKVKIALLPQDSYSLKDGEVLVCSMTGPDYVPAMKRASAVVTDEGGLLSHAAIMSREFGKPCIVGTKIATKVLKDGDIVEVDANKGIVRILN